MTAGGWGRGPGGAEIRYARNGGVAIAYQVVGDGDTDLVYVPDFVSNLACGWDYPLWREFYMRLSRSFRLILFDKRGTGISDHGGQFAALETRMEDLHAVLDAAGSAKPVIFGAHEGGGMAVLFAATYPERTRALVLFHAQAKPDRPAPEAAMRELARLRDNWGTQEFADELLADGCPSLPATRRAVVGSRTRCVSAPVPPSPTRSTVPSAKPTSAMSCRRSTFRRCSSTGRCSKRKRWRSPLRLPNARTMRVSGTDYFGIFLSPEIADEIERFVGGEDAPEVPESVLATVMFTDIVGSTERVAEIGDRAWRDLLAEHHAIVRRELSRFRGQERDTAGDGFFATFDGPARAIRAAEAIVDGVRTIGLEARIGIHVGECEIHDGKVTGLAVAIGARVASNAGPGEVLVSQTVRDLVAGTGIEFTDRATHELKGVPGTWQLLAFAPAESNQELATG